jgi:protoheme IX farnesyltransferase
MSTRGRDHGWLADVVALGKPHITMLSTLMGAGGLYLAPAAIGTLRSLAALAGIALFVAAANALNMVIERDLDRRMERTRDRPLPAGRLSPALALALGVGGALLAAVGTALVVNLLTAALGALALLLYVLVYTPLKRRTPHAMLVGAIAGAMPPLMGWSAATGAVGGAGLGLFLVLGVWQLPHFLAISIYRREDYARAGFRAPAVAFGERATARRMVLWSGLLIPVTLLLVVLGGAGPVYLAAAGGFGLVFLGAALRLLAAREALEVGARRVFRLSLLHLPILAAAITIEAVLR